MSIVVVLFLLSTVLVWFGSRFLFNRIFKVEPAMSEALAWALAMIVPLLSLYTWGSMIMGK
jgi:hypothetical protein